MKACSSVTHRTAAHQLFFGQVSEGAPCLQVESAKDIINAEKLLFPGVGSYGQAMDVLLMRGYVDALKEHIAVPPPAAPCCHTPRHSP